MTGLFLATGVHDVKQKGRANLLKNQAWRPIVPAAKQRKETRLSEKSGIWVPSGRLVPAPPQCPQSRVDWGFQAKGTEIFRAFLYGGGAAPPVKPSELGSFLLPMAVAKNCGNLQPDWQSIRGRLGDPPKLLTPVQIRIPHLNRRPHFFHNTTWLWDENTPSWSTTNSFGRKPVDTKHLGQKQLAARWGLSEATLERWRSEGIGPMYLKLLGRVCYRLCDIEEFESSCLRIPTAKQAA